MTWSALPGGDLIADGVADLCAGVVSPNALLVSIGATRLRSLGVAVSNPVPDADHRLWQLLAATDPDSAHGRYNALVRRLVSFERALACVA